MKIHYLRTLALVSITTCVLPASAQFLFNEYLEPSFADGPNTEFSRWDVFYAPNGGANRPDSFAPNGLRTSASAVGATPPPDSAPPNPIAFWDSTNPTIRQTNSGHFIIGPGTAGNIYSPGTQGLYELSDTTPFTLGTVVFQFQTEGNLVNLASIRLQYNTGVGMQTLSAMDYIREYSSGTSGFGGLTNRVAVQWDLTGLGITNYQILWNSSSSSMSFQQALLDTSAAFSEVVPGSRTWTVGGAGVWSAGANWAQGTTSVENGNVRFSNANATSITLDTNRNVGEIIFDTSANSSISGPGILRSNTGITTQEDASGLYTISSAYRLGAFNVMDIQAGTVRLEGVVSGAFGMSKFGDGTLVLANNNTFGSASGGLSIDGGALRVEGTNTYGGTTSVFAGRLELAASAGFSGALGSTSSSIVLGSSDSLLSVIPDDAVIAIDGDHTLGRNVAVTAGSFTKRIGAENTTLGAVVSGGIVLQNSSLYLYAASADDRLTLSGGISGGGIGRTLFINSDGAAGTVVFSGGPKSYVNNTTVAAGTLLLASGASTTGNGTWQVQAGATLVVDGTVGGSGSFSLADGATVGGSGTLNKTFTVANGATLSPGNSTGAFATLSQTWAGSGVYRWELSDTSGVAGATAGWDLVNVDGTLAVTATFNNPFVIELHTLGLDGAAAGFDALTDYEWVIASTNGGINGFDASSFSINTAGFTNPTNGSFALFASGNDLFLAYTAIPEPGTLALLVALGVGLGAVAIRRCRSKQTYQNPKPNDML